MAGKKQEHLDFYEGWNDNFATLRANRRMTQADVAKALNYTDRTISAIETGVRKPTIEQLNAYSKYFNVSLDYLTGRTRIHDQSITSEIGLSQNTINKLRDIKNSKDFGPMLIKTIEFMIEHDKLLEYVFDFALSKRPFRTSEAENIPEYYIAGLNYGKTRLTYDNMKRMFLILFEEELLNIRKGIRETNYELYDGYWELHKADKPV